jgi:hypothetical protein
MTLIQITILKNSAFTLLACWVERLGSISIDNRLVQFLEDAKDWEKKATNIPGVFLLKLPSFKRRSAALAIEVNPLGASGAVTKKRGIVVRSSKELEEINKLLSHPKMAELAKLVDQVNPEKAATETNSESTVFEI